MQRDEGICRAISKRQSKGMQVASGTFDCVLIRVWADLIYEEDAGDDVSLAFLPPLCDLGVDLLAHLGPYLPGVPRKQRQEPLQSPGAFCPYFP